MGSNHQLRRLPCGFSRGGLIAKKDLPPYPGKIVGSDGKLLFQSSDILAGQDVYQRYGLMDHGSVWGHGSRGSRILRDFSPPGK